MNIYTYVHYYIKKKSICAKKRKIRLKNVLRLHFIHLTSKHAFNAKKNGKFGKFPVLLYMYRIFVYAYIYLCIRFYVFIIVSKTTRKTHKNGKNKNAKKHDFRHDFLGCGVVRHPARLRRFWAKFAEPRNFFWEKIYKNNFFIFLR